VDRRVVLSGSTGDGLGWLALQEQADIIVFGSDYRTPRGHVSIGRSAQTLLERGPAALAIAPAEYHAEHLRRIERIGVLPGSADEAAIETAFSLGERLEATVVDSERQVDLLIVGSRSEAPEGFVSISSRSQNAIEAASSPVLVVARGVALRFETLVTA
jgi:nucleotide-binding universal stress UspA family protein